MIKVYFETDNWFCMPVAYFDDEDTYMACLPALEALAGKNGYIVTESVKEYELEDVDKLIKKEFND